MPLPLTASGLHKLIEQWDLQNLVNASLCPDSALLGYHLSPQAAVPHNDYTLTNWGRVRERGIERDGALPPVWVSPGLPLAAVARLLPWDTVVGDGGGGRGREEVEGGDDNSDETKGDSVVSVPSQGVQGTRE